MEESILIRKGRTRENYLRTEFDTIDYILNIDSDICKSNPMTLLGFYTTLKRYINRKDYSRENEINFKQSTLKGKMKISNTLYYDLLKVAFNTSLLDIEKFMKVVYFINFNSPDSPNLRCEEDIAVLSSISNFDIFVDTANIAGYIAKNKNIPIECIKIVSISNYISYIINEYPLEIAVTGGMLSECRSWDEFMSRYNKPRPGAGRWKKGTSLSKAEIESTDNLSDDGDSAEKNIGVYAEKNNPVSVEKNEGVSSEQNPNNNIIKLINSNIELLNNKTELLANKINNLSVYQKDRNFEKKEGLEKGLIDVDKDFGSIIYNLQLDSLSKPISDLIKNTLTEIYYNPYISEKVIRKPFEVVKERLKGIDIETVEYAVQKYLDAEAGGTVIEKPHLYFATCIWTALIDSKLENLNELKEDQVYSKVVDERRKMFTSDMGNIVGFQEELLDPLYEVYKGLSELTYNAWFKTIGSIYRDKDILIIVVYSDFHKEKLLVNHRYDILRAYKQIGITSVEIVETTPPK